MPKKIRKNLSLTALVILEKIAINYYNLKSKNELVLCYIFSSDYY